MAVGITVTKDAVETLAVEIGLTGLTVGTRYDVHRLQLRYLGDDDFGDPMYERELPDRKSLWSAVAHRVGWAAPATTATFRDYECPLRPTAYFVVPTASVGPYGYDWSDGDYPLDRGVLSSTVVHWSHDLFQAGGKLQTGAVFVRSTAELSLFVDACVYDFNVHYPARGTEHAVMGRQYPMYVADTREARRGTLTLRTDTLGQYDDLRRIVFPATGRIHPVIFNSGPDATLLLDDLWLIPLDVEVQQATHSSADVRFILIDYVEVDPTAPLLQRTGDNDTLTQKPVANFTISNANPKSGDWITLTDTSTGQFTGWDWTIDRGSNNKVAKFYTQGPHPVRFTQRGKKTVKLRVYGPQGAHTRTRTVNVR